MLTARTDPKSIKGCAPEVSPVPLAESEAFTGASEKPCPKSDFRGGAIYCVTAVDEEFRASTFVSAPGGERKGCN